MKASMQNTDPNTMTFSPPEGGFTDKQIAEYEAFKVTDAEWKEYGDALKSGHLAGRTSIASAGNGRSFNEIFGSPKNSGFA